MREPGKELFDTVFNAFVVLEHATQKEIEDMLQYAKASTFIPDLLSSMAALAELLEEQR